MVEWPQEILPELNRAMANAYKIAWRDGALDKKTKEIIAVVVASVLRCKHCTENHLEKAIKAGATKKQIAEAIGVAWMMGGAPPIQDLDEYLL